LVLSHEGVFVPPALDFGRAPYIGLGAGLYKENIPVHDFFNERLWSVRDLQPGFQSGLGRTGGIGFQQRVGGGLTVMAEGNVIMGVSSEITGSGSQDGGDIHYYRDLRGRSLLGLSFGLQYEF
jgi:hypothetical protein